MKLSDYKNNEKTKIENLSEFFADNRKWQEDYIESCPDFLDGYGDVLFNSEMYLEELYCDDKTLVEYLIENNETDLIYNSCSVERTSGIHCVSNELASYSFGEIEVQFSGLSDDNCNCIYSEIIKGMSKKDIETAKSESRECISNDCLYLDYSYDRASLILDVDSLINEFLGEL